MAGAFIQANSNQIDQQVLRNTNVISIFHKTTTVIFKKKTVLDLLQLILWQVSTAIKIN